MTKTYQTKVNKISTSIMIF